VLENAENASPVLLAAIRKHLGLEEEQPKQQQQQQAKPVAGAVLKRDVEGAVKAVLRSLSMKYHPDRGGSSAQMQVVNEVSEQLLRALSGIQEAR